MFGKEIKYLKKMSFEKSIKIRNSFRKNTVIIYLATSNIHLTHDNNYNKMWKFILNKIILIETHNLKIVPVASLVQVLFPNGNDS